MRRFGRRPVRGGTGAPLDPRAFLTVLLDLWADKRVTEAGTGVSSWIDDKGGSINFTQGTDGVRPSLVTWRNGKRGVDFVRANSDRLNVTLTADQLLAASNAYTVLCYGELDALASATQSLIDFGNGRSWALFESGNAGNPIGIFDSAAYRSVGADPSTGAHFWEWSVPGGAGGLTVYQDGVALGTTPDVVTLAGLGGSTYLGSVDGAGSGHLDGKLGRVLVVQGTLTTAQRDLARKWGQYYYSLP